MNKTTRASVVIRVLLFLILSSLCPSEVWAEQPILDKFDVVDQVLKHREEFIRKLTQGEREKYIIAIREINPYNPDWSWNDRDNRRSEFTVLMRLGDAQTARWLVAQHHVSERGSGNFELMELLSNWTSYEGYKFMGDLVCLDQEYKQYAGGMDVPVSFNAAQLLFENMIPNTYTFPKTVREWVKENFKQRVRANGIIIQTRERSPYTLHERISEFFITSREREIARNWWKANEKAISEGRWGDVKRGESYMDEKFYQMIAQIEAMAKAAESPTPPDTSPVVKKPRLPSLPSANPASRPKPPGEQPPSTAQKPANGWFDWLLAATGVLTAAILLVLFRKKAVRK